MRDAVRWELLCSVPSGLEADQVRAVLEGEGIPVLIKGVPIGIFGAGFQGSIPGGVEVMVPSPELERARQLLDEAGEE